MLRADPLSTHISCNGRPHLLSPRKPPRSSSGRRNGGGAFAAGRALMPDDFGELWSRLTGKERKGKERKGKERKGKERKGVTCTPRACCACCQSSSCTCCSSSWNADLAPAGFGTQSLGFRFSPAENLATAPRAPAAPAAGTPPAHLQGPEVQGLGFMLGVQPAGQGSYYVSISSSRGDMCTPARSGVQGARTHGLALGSNLNPWLGRR